MMCSFISIFLPCHVLRAQFNPQLVDFVKCHMAMPVFIAAQHGCGPSSVCSVGGHRESKQMSVCMELPSEARAMEPQTQGPKWCDKGGQEAWLCLVEPQRRPVHCQAHDPQTRNWDPLKESHGTGDHLQLGHKHPVTNVNVWTCTDDQRYSRKHPMCNFVNLDI